MSRPENVSNARMFDKGSGYVITPTYETEDELDKEVEKLTLYAKHFHPNMRLPQRVFLKILGVRQPIGSREYKNDVLLETGEKHNVANDQGDILYWYERFKTIVTGRHIVDKGHGYDLNSYAGSGGNL